MKHDDILLYALLLLIIIALLLLSLKKITRRWFGPRDVCCIIRYDFMHTRTFPLGTVYRYFDKPNIPDDVCTVV